MSNFHSRVQKFDSNLWGHHFSVPDNIAQSLIEGDNRRVICHLNEKINFQAALMPSQSGWYILLNKKIRDTLNISEDDEIAVYLEKDRSEYGMEMPEELIEVLFQEEKAWESFQKLSRGKQRTLIYIVLKVKNTDSRIRKALAIAHHLKENKLNLDFKRLNELIKYYNQMK